MGRLTLAAAVATALLASSAVAQSSSSSIPSCGGNSKCPADSPCCSQYGQCGVGAYCLGGCNPLYSFDFQSCVPSAVCKSTDYNLNSLSDVESINDYLGDYSSTNWVASGNPASYSNGNDQGVLLTMAQDTVGTLMATTHYVWYGKISATLRTSQGAGVVTAFILMSDVKDEIDFEFVGADIHHAQSNFYSQGVTDYTNGKNLSVSGDTVSEDHTYTVDWQPDSLTWSVDGVALRTLNRNDTWNSTANRWDYPQTPSRVMLSLWPAGLPSNGQGTITWAGGLINWNSQYMSDGYYYALVKDVNVECYDPPPGAQIAGSHSYVYTDAAGTNNTVKIVDDVVILKSLYASGDDPNECPDCTTSASKGSHKPTSTASTSKPSATPQTVPGEVGTGGRADGAADSSSSGSSSGSGSSGSGSGSSGSAAGGNSGNTGGGTFQQGGDDSSSGTGSSNDASGLSISKTLGGSVLAAVAVFGAMLVM